MADQSVMVSVLDAIEMVILEIQQNDGQYSKESLLKVDRMVQLAVAILPRLSLGYSLLNSPVLIQDCLMNV